MHKPKSALVKNSAAAKEMMVDHASDSGKMGTVFEILELHTAQPVLLVYILVRR